MSVTICLTGGLGNQLFQYFAGLSLARKRNTDLIVHSKIGRPRSSDGLADLLAFNLNAVVDERRMSKSSRIQGKAFNHLITSSLDEAKTRKTELLKYSTHLMSMSLLKAYFRDFSINNVISAQDLGFIDLNQVRDNSLIIGYFQSYQYYRALTPSDQILCLREQLVDRNTRDDFNIATQVNPLIVHRRLSDYRKEKDFGIPNASCFHAPIRALWSSGRFGEIWAFTDETEFEMQCIPSAFHRNVRVFSRSNRHPAVTIKLMSQGKAFVISNSSFSYWAAMFSKNLDAKVEVYAPSIWFKNGKSPKDLICPDWELYETTFEN